MVRNNSTILKLLHHNSNNNYGKKLKLYVNNCYEQC